MGLLLLHHHHHLQTTEPVPEIADLSRQRLVISLQMRDVLGRFAQHCSLVELMCWRQASQHMLLHLERHVCGNDIVHDDATAVAGQHQTIAITVHALGHEAERRDSVAQGGDLVIEVCAVPLLNHVMCGLAQRVGWRG